MRVLITYNDTWGDDDTEVSGFMVVEEADWTNMILNARKFFKRGGNHIVHIGANYDIEYHGFNEFNNTLEVTELTNAQYQMLIDLGFETFGIIPDFEDFNSDMEDYENYDTESEDE